MSEHPSVLLRLWGLKDPPDRKAVVLAYRRRAQRLHPDRAGNTPQAHAAFIQLRAQYEQLLQYSDNPAASPAPEQIKRPAPAPVSSTFAWIVPPADITLRRFWKLRQAWLGDTVVLRYPRGVACECTAGCPRCHESRVRFQTATLEVSVPSLNRPNLRVRLEGVGHRGDYQSGNVWLELVWVRTGGWIWRDGALHKTIGVRPGAPWVYVQSPTGQWFRVAHPTPSPVWQSPSGLCAYIHCPPTRWGLRQKVAAGRWAWSCAGSWHRRIELAVKAISQV